MHKDNFEAGAPVVGQRSSRDAPLPTPGRAVGRRPAETQRTDARGQRPDAHCLPTLPLSLAEHTLFPSAFHVVAAIP